MRTTIRKFFGVWAYEKEEKWLNEMAAMGLNLVKVGWCKYTFENCEKGEYTYRIQLLEKKVEHPDSAEYIEFVENTGAEFVDNYMKWAYFRKKTYEGEFELFSDNAGRIKHAKAIRAFVLAITLFNLYIGFYNLFLVWIWDSHFNVIGLINIALGVIGLVYIAKLNSKIKKMKKEQQIFE